MLRRFAPRNDADNPAPCSTVIPAHAGIQYAAASRFNHQRLWDTGSPACAGDDTGIWVCILAAHCARSFADRFALDSSEGAGNAGCALHPRSHVHRALKNEHMSIQGSGEHPTFPAQWLYGLWRALPGEQLFCLRSALGNRTSPKWIDASTATSGPHAFAVRFSTCRLRHLHVHRIPVPRRDDGRRPSEWDGIHKKCR